MKGGGGMHFWKRFGQVPDGGELPTGGTFGQGTAWPCAPDDTAYRPAMPYDAHPGPRCASPIGPPGLCKPQPACQAPSMLAVAAHSPEQTRPPGALALTKACLGPMVRHPRQPMSLKIGPQIQIQIRPPPPYPPPPTHPRV